MLAWLGVVLLSPAASAQDTQSGPPTGAQTQAPAPAQPDTTFNITVVGTTPLPGVELPADRVPAPVQTGTAEQIEKSGALDLGDFLNRRMNGVHVNEVQGNPFQPDVNYRGYTASPLLGTPQGLSVYMDGVRMNQPFGEVVSWDLIPRIALATTTLIPGSNPVFGLNTLGGALSLETKDGRTHGGTTLLATYGSDGRRLTEFEHGGRTTGAFHWYVAGSLFGEDGWRDASPSDVNQLFGKIGWQTAVRELTMSLGYANNWLTGNGLQEMQLLDRDRASTYTKPDTTDNRSTLLNVVSRHQLTQRVSVLANGYYRDIRTATLNGDINEESLDQALYQPTAAERAALAAAGYGNVPASGLNSENTPFPSLRCIANGLLDDGPAETCNGLINRTRTGQRNGGASVQLTRRDPIQASENLFTAGAAFDHSATGFEQSTELGYLNPDRSVTGIGAFGDGLTGGTVDGEPYDTRVDLDGSITTWSVYATDTLPIGSRVHLTLSGRYNHVSIENRDRIEPGGNPGSLDGNHTFDRFNPAAGITVRLSPAASVYAGYGEGSRAPTAIELGCADPEEPCKLPNAMAGDPPLGQVVTRSIEGGVRGTHRQVAWYVSGFRAANSDDILFVTSGQTGFGYFRNFGETIRQGFETGAKTRVGRLTVGAGYTFLRATFESEESLNGGSNSTNGTALAGAPGLEGSIDIEPGNRMPLIPQHLLKVFGEAEITSHLQISADLIATGSSYARGNENNAHQPDGVYYLGPGAAAGSAVINLGGRYAVTRWLEVVGQVNNLFDRRYVTAAQLGPTGFNADGTFIAQPLPPIDGEFPVRQSTFQSPGAPARGWLGVRVRF